LPLRLRLKAIVPSKERRICGELVFINKPISYLGDLDPKRGTVLNDVSVKNKVLVYLGGIGSTVGSYKILGLNIEGNKPKALIVTKSDVVTVVGAVLADIPLYELSRDDFSRLEDVISSSGRNWSVSACIEDEVLSIDG